jgi:hypothetical protein
MAPKRLDRRREAHGALHRRPGRAAVPGRRRLGGAGGRFPPGRAFVTLDYSDGDKPVLYGGTAQSRSQMQCQLLRDDEAIKASAGSYRGRLDR